MFGPRNYESIINFYIPKDGALFNEKNAQQKRHLLPLKIKYNKKNFFCKGIVHKWRDAILQILWPPPPLFITEALLLSQNPWPPRPRRHLYGRTLSFFVSYSTAH